MALITIPLACQLGISAILLEQLSASEQKLEKRISRMRIVASLDEVQRLHVRCLAAAAFYSVSRDEEIGKKHISGLKQLAAELKELRQLTGDQPDLAQRTTELQKAIIAVVPYEMMMRKFSIVEDRSKGSGLGLFISKKLAEAQSGRLDFSSRVGYGSKFWLELPEAGRHLME